MTTLEYDDPSRELTERERETVDDFYTELTLVDEPTAQHFRESIVRLTEHDVATHCIRGKSH